MGITNSEKIFAKKSGRERVPAGDFVTAKVDLAAVLDVAGPHVAKAFQELGARKIWDKKKVIGFLDAVPASSVQAAENQKAFRDFARRIEIQLAPYGEGIYHSGRSEGRSNLPGYLHQWKAGRPGDSGENP